MNSTRQISLTQEEKERIRSRLFSRSIPNDKTGCLEFTGSCSKSRYAMFKFRNKSFLVHRLSFAAFTGNVPEDMCVLHTCDNPRCINPDHLWLGTRGDNNRDSAEKGRRACGTKNASCKLTALQVREIRSRCGVKRESHRALAEVFGVSHNTIGSIVRGDHWKIAV